MSEPEGSVPTFDRSDFDGERLRRPGRFAVAAVAGWCPFCEEFVPRFLRRRPTNGWRLAFADLTDLEDPRWEALRIDVVPTVLLYEEGRLVDRIDGTSRVGVTERELDRLSERMRAPGTR